MTLEPIQVQLSNFEKLEILRAQREEREKELSELEKNIRHLQRKIATHRYLEGLSPYYAMTSSDLPSPDEIAKLEEKRNIIRDLIQAIDQEIPQMLSTAHTSDDPAGESAPSPAAAPSPPPAGEGGGSRKASFDF